VPIIVLLGASGIFAEIGDRRARLIPQPQFVVPGTRCARPEGKNAASFLIF
jgi:hypothetical protein